MAFVDPDTVHVPSAGNTAPAAWGVTVNDNLNYFNNPPRTKVYRSAVYGIVHNTVTMVAWNAEEYDTDTIHSTSSNTTRLTATTEGRYLVQCRIVFDINNSGLRRLKLWKNGTSGELVEAAGDDAPSSGSYSRLLCSTWVELDAGDYIEAEVFQTSGGDLSVIGAAIGTNERSWFGMQWLGTR